MLASPPLGLELPVVVPLAPFFMAVPPPVVLPFMESPVVVLLAAGPPAEMAAENTANFPTKPLVNGIPAKASRRNANALAASGERRPRPAHCERCVAS